MFFRDILGQDRVIGFLRQALKTGQMPHALLFLGSEGVGKSSTALALARALNCEDRQPDADACGRCRSCRMFGGGGHPDFWQIHPEGEGAHPPIKVDQIRELSRKINFPPMAGAWRVVLVKPAEAMNLEAANAFLKTLEEPPEGNVFILTAMGERDLLPTIVSRCRRFNFNPIPHTLLARELERRQKLTAAQAALAAALHAGSLGQALAANLPELLARRDQVVEELELLNRGGIGEVLQWAAAKSQKNSGLDQFISLAGLWYRDLLALSHRGAASLLVNQDRLPDLASQQQQLAKPVLLARLEALNLLQRQARSNLNTELMINNFALKWRQADGSRQSP